MNRTKPQKGVFDHYFLKRNNKKGIVYSLGIVVLTLVVLLMAFTYYFSEKSSLRIGDSQAEIFQTYQEAQHDLINLDLKVKQSAIKSLYNLAKNSGYNNEGNCGKYYDIPLLSYKNQINNYTECLPNLEEEFEKEFKENFQKKLREEDQNNHEYFAIKNKTQFQITGFALRDKEIQIGKEEGKRILSYRPSFRDKTKYNFSIYEKIIPKFLKDLSEACQDKENNKENYKELDECVEDFRKKFSNENKEFEIQTYNENNKTYILSQNFKDADNINFDDCFTIVNNPFKATGLVYPEDRFYFETQNEKSSIINQEKNYDVDLNHKFYFYDDSKEIPYKKIDQKYSLDVSAEFLENRNDLSESYEMFGIALFEHEGDFYYVPKKTYQENQNYFTSRFCEIENRKYSFIIKDKEIYPEEGILEYKFSVYIKDLVKPEIKDFEIIDKEFDEDTLLVRWKHSISNDVTKYEIYLNDKLNKTIVPWKSLNIYDKIDWNYGNQNIFETCNLEKDDRDFTQCYYNFNNGKGLLEDNQIYYFKESKEFVYVLKLNEEKDVKIKIMSHDDDRNYYSEEKSKSYPLDTLPYAPVKNYKIVPIPDVFIEGYYFSVNYVDPTSLVLGTAADNYNMDGTISEIIPTEYVLFHKRDALLNLNELSLYTQDPFIIGQPTIRISDVYNLEEEINYFLVLKDPSLENINRLTVDEFGFIEFHYPLELVSE